MSTAGLQTRTPRRGSPQPGSVRRGPVRRGRKLALDALTWGLVLAAITPAVWVVFTAFRPNREINAVPAVWIPERLTTEAFETLFGVGGVGGNVPIHAYLRNSLTAALLSTIVAVTIGTLAGYAFSRYDFRGKNALFLGLMLSRAVPGVALGLPLFILFGSVRLLDSSYALALAYVAINIPITIWLMDGFFREIPSDLAEAAELDGANTWQVFFRVYLPLARPGIAASSIFAFLVAWNEYQIAVVLTRTPASKTFPVGLFDFTQQFTFDWRGMAAMSVVMMVPAIVFILFVQRNMMRGLTFGATKN